MNIVVWTNNKAGRGRSEYDTHYNQGTTMVPWGQTREETTAILIVTLAFRAKRDTDDNVGDNSKSNDNVRLSSTDNMAKRRKWERYE